MSDDPREVAEQVLAALEIELFPSHFLWPQVERLRAALATAPAPASTPLREAAGLEAERDLWHTRAVAMFWKLPAQMKLGEVQDQIAETKAWVDAARAALATAPPGREELERMLDAYENAAVRLGAMGNDITEQASEQCEAKRAAILDLVCGRPGA